MDKEVVIIDREEYVKVLNPRASEGRGQPRYLYIPVDEYLSKKEAYAAQGPRKDEVTKEPLSPVKSPSPPVEREVFSVSPSRASAPSYKKKVVITHFDDHTPQTEEVFGDWMAEKLTKEVDRRSNRLLIVDFQMVREFLEKKEIPLKDLETPKVLQLLNEIFGIHALVIGHLIGPYAFSTKGPTDQEGTASAIIKIEMKVINAFSGKTLKTLTASNPVLAAKMKGSFSEERAKEKAIEVTLANLGQSLSRELEGLDWFCRVAKVEGEEIYLNAGKLTGIKIGDEMEIVRPGELGEVKGKIRILGYFGIDASMAKLITGKTPDADDIVRLAKRERT